MDYIMWGIPVVMTIFMVLIVFLVIKKTKCPACGKYGALKVTGRTDKERYTRIETTYSDTKKRNEDYTVTYQKYQIHNLCKYCNYTFSENCEEVVSRIYKF